MAILIKKRSIHTKSSPQYKRYVKRKMSKKRRKLLKQRLKDLEYTYNKFGDVKDIDYCTDYKYFKIKSRQGVAADFIERRTTNSRLIIAHMWYFFTLFSETFL